MKRLKYVLPDVILGTLREEEMSIDHDLIDDDERNIVRR